MSVQIENDVRAQLTPREMERLASEQLQRMLDRFERLQGGPLRAMLVLYPAGKDPVSSATVSTFGMDLGSLEETLRALLLRCQERV